MPLKRRKCADRAAGYHQFITVSHPDDFRLKDTQREIRSAAMAALGKARRKCSSKNNIVTLCVPETARWGEQTGTEPAITDTSLIPARNVKPTPEAWLQYVPPELPHLGVFPVEPSRRARELIHFMNGEASICYRPFRYGWFAMAMQDTTAFYLCLANASLFMHQHVSQQENHNFTNSVESMKYYSKCLRELSMRLDDETQNTSDGVITAIMGFICIYSTAGHWRHSFLHLDGLGHVVRLRGGFKGLHQNMPLFATWFDLTLAAVSDQPPRFLLPGSLRSNAASQEELPPALTALIQNLSDSLWELDHVIESLGLVSRLATYVNKHCERRNFWESGIESTNLIRPAAHVVLTIPRLSEVEYCLDETSDLRLLASEMVRLALLVFLATLKKAFSLIADELGSYLERFSAFTPLMVMLPSCPELKIWAAILVACAQKGPTPQRQIAEIRRAMEEANIPTARAAVQMAREIIWADTLLEPAVERVQREIEQHPR